MIRNAITTILNAAAGVTTPTGSRIYRDRMLEGEGLPQVTYLVVDSPRDHTQEGPSGLVYSRVQVSCWAASQDATALDAIVAAVRKAIVAAKGTTVDGTRIDGVLVLDERELPDPDADLVQVALEFRVLHDEAIA